MREKKPSFFISVFMIAILVRGATLFLSLDSFNDDPDAYRALAENVYSHGIFGSKEVATAFRPPLYPATLAATIPLRVQEERPVRLNAADHLHSDNSESVATFFNKRLALSRNASIALWHWLLGVVTIALAYTLALKLNLTPPVAAIAALLVAVDPILLQQSRLVMTETLAVFFAVSLILATIIVTQRRLLKTSFTAYLFLGALYGLSTLCRPTFFLFFALTLVTLILIEERTFKSTRRRSELDDQTENVAVVSPISCCARILCFILGCSCCVVPWGVRNYRVFGKPILTTTHGGYTLLLANNPEIFQHYTTASSPWTLWKPDDFFKRNKKDYEEALAEASLNSPEKQELFQDEWSRQQAFETIKENPTIFAYSCFIRFGELWRFLPNDVESNDSKSTRRQSFRLLGTTLERSYLKKGARYAIAVFYLLEFFLATIGCVKLYRTRQRGTSKRSLIESPFVWGFLLILSIQIPHIVYWTNMRMRAPLEVFLPILVAVAFIPCSATPNPQNECIQ